MRGLREIDARAWNDFARSCGASYLCAHEYIGMRGIGRRVTCVEHFVVPPSGEAVKVAQCALVSEGRTRAFCDTLQVSPGHAGSWAALMAATLEAVGPGPYRYGSRWHLEPDRSEALRSVPRARLTDVRHHAVQYVDFGDWDGWDAYWGAVSANVRRNARKFADLGGTVRAEGPVGGWRFHRDFYRTRRGLIRRKRLGKDALRATLRMLLRGLFLRRYVRLRAAERGGDRVAFYCGVDFGANAHYLEGASGPDNGGASWLLLQAALREAHDRSGGRGRFVFGHDPRGLAGTDPTWAPLIRSRRQCRVRDCETSQFSFTYGG